MATVTTPLPIIALPISIEYATWFNSLRQDLPTFDIPDARDEANWIEDAQYLLRNRQCDNINCPQPSAFTNWRDWAQRWVAAFGGQI